MNRPQTTVELMTANLLKAQLWDKLVERIAANEIVVRPTDCDGGELDKVTNELGLTNLIHARGEFEGLFGEEN